ncbi:MAG TPA: hypothetical protein VM555_08265 [Tahibacter sp.]|jgi:hypothetical protein|nr:hypothetical protein [Tahibacter sp.]
MDIYYDLLTYASNEPFVRALLASPKGRWLLANDILQGLDLAFDAGGDEVYVTYIDTVEQEADYVFIIFFNQTTGQTKTAVYNSGRLLRAFADAPGSLIELARGRPKCSAKKR